MSGFSVAAGLSEPLRITYSHRTTGITGSGKLAEPFVFFGRHLQNAVRLNDPSVSKRHAYVQILDGCPFAVDLGSRTGIRIAGHQTAQGWVDLGQTLEVGDYDIQFTGPLNSAVDRQSPTDLAPEASHLQVAFLPGAVPQGLLYCPLRSAITLIGRDPHCNLRLLDKRIGLFHVSIVQTPTDTWLIDLPGSGGTRLNGRSARCSLIRVGDRVSLNGVSLEVQLNRHVPAEPEMNGALEPVSDKMGQFSPATEAMQPLVEQVGDLRQATLLMASLFAEMKREQTHLMQRQCDLMEVMTQAFRDSRPPAPLPLAAPPVDAAPSPMSVPLQSPRMTKPGEEDALAQAHEWFLSRLQKMGK